MSDLWLKRQPVNLIVFLAHIHRWVADRQVVFKVPYTTSQLSEIVDIPQRKVLSYIERGYISPSVQEASGPGTKRLWSHAALVRCAVMKYLLDFLPVDALRRIAKPISDDQNVAPESVWIITVINGTHEFVSTVASNIGNPLSSDGRCHQS